MRIWDLYNKFYDPHVYFGGASHHYIEGYDEIHDPVYNPFPTPGSVQDPTPTRQQIILFSVQSNNPPSIFAFVSFVNVWKPSPGST